MTSRKFSEAALVSRKSVGLAKSAFGDHTKKVPWRRGPRGTALCPRLRPFQRRALARLVCRGMLRRAASAASRASRGGLSSSRWKAREDYSLWAPLARWSAVTSTWFVPGQHARAFTTDDTPRSVLTNHPRRREVASVLHARPWQRIACPSLISSITTTQKFPVVVDGVSCPMAVVVDSKASYDNDYTHLVSLCEHFLVTPPPHGVAFWTQAMSGISLRWERHTEVCTYTFSRELTAQEESAPELFDPFSEKNVVSSLLPKTWLSSFPGGVVSATHVVLTQGDARDGWGSSASEDASENTSQSASEKRALKQKETSPSNNPLHKIKPLFNHSEMITGSQIDRGRFRVYSDWRVHGDGFGRVLIYHDPSDTRAFVSSAAGKAAQRMIELGTYWAFPKSQHGLLPLFDCSTYNTTLHPFLKLRTLRKTDTFLLHS